MKKQFMKRQRGFTMVELGIVVVIGFLIVGIGLSKGPTILSNYKSNAEVQELPEIVNVIQKAYVSATSFTGVTLTNIANADAFPAKRVTAGTPPTITNRWGGAVTWAVATVTTTGDTGRLVYASVPQAECKAVVNGAEGLFRRIFVDPANAGTAGAGTEVKANGAILNVGTLNATCAALNTITYDFPK